MTTSVSAHAKAPKLQRKCGCEASPTSHGACSDCERKRVQRSALGGGRGGDVPDVVYDVLRSPGRALDIPTRAFFEGRFGQEPGSRPTPLSSAAPDGLSISEPGDAGEREADRMAEQAMRTPDPASTRQGPGFDFRRVRIHADERAAESARAVAARAYTVGQDIVFAAGQFAPGTTWGRELLAHELAHTTQQMPRVSRVPDGPPARQLPQHVPKAPSMRSAAASTIPCATTGCPEKIPGSAWDFSHPPNALSGDLSYGKTAGVPSVHFKKFVETEAPELSAGVHEIHLSADPEVARIGVTWGDCPKPPADDPSAGCVDVSLQVEQEAKLFNQGAANIGGQSREDWSFGVKRPLSWAAGNIRFSRSPTPGLPSGNTIAMWELKGLHAWLGGFPIDYERAMSLPTADAQKAKLTEYIGFRIESRTVGVRGILTRLRCTLSCEEVNESITKVFGEVTAGWKREMRDALLFGLMDPARRLSWPPGPGVPKTFTFPAEPRPRPTPLYVPRGGFESEAGKSGERL